MRSVTPVALLFNCSADQVAEVERAPSTQIAPADCPAAGVTAGVDCAVPAAFVAHWPASCAPEATPVYSAIQVTGVVGEPVKVTPVSPPAAIL